MQKTLDTAFAMLAGTTAMAADIVRGNVAISWISIKRRNSASAYPPILRYSQSLRSCRQGCLAAMRALLSSDNPGNDQISDGHLNIQISKPRAVHIAFP